MEFSLPRKLAAEALGTCILLATVVGSGIMADALSDDAAVSLLGNTLPTGAILIVLITIFGPLSGAHFNPVVSLIFFLRRDIDGKTTALFAIAQVGGGMAGCFLAHVMFELPVWQVSLTSRSGVGQWVAEIIATFGLVGTILAGLRFRESAVAWLVGLYITAAYWFTASTSFANPAVAIARGFSDTFAGIRPVDVPAFIVAQCIGGVAALLFFTWLLRSERPGLSSTEELNARSKE